MINVESRSCVGDEIWVRDTVNTNFMEGVLLVVSTGFAPGSIYGSTFAPSTLLPSSQYGVLTSYQEVWLRTYKAFSFSSSNVLRI